MQKIFLSLIYLFFSVLAFASDGGVELVSETFPADGAGCLEHLEDESGRLSFQEVSNPALNNHFVRVGDELRSFGIDHSVHWFRLKLTNRTKINNWLIHVDYPVLNRITFYVQNDSGQLDTVIYQGLDPEKGKKTDNRYPLASVNFECNRTYNVFMRVQTNSYLFLPLKIEPVNQFLQSAGHEQTIYLTLYGLFMGLVLLNLILLVLTREKTYLWLSLFLFSLMVNSFHQYRIGFQIFEASNQVDQLSTRTMLFYISLIVFSFFSIDYLDVHRYKKLYHIFHVIILFFALVLVLTFLTIIPIGWVNKISPVIYLLGAFFGVGTAIFTAWKGNRTSIFYLIAFSAFFLSSVIWILLMNGFLLYTFFVYHINLFSGSLFGLLLTIGLIEKITAVKREKAKSAELEAINLRFEQEIKERTQLEKSLKENEEKFRLLFHLSPMSISLIDLKTGAVIDLNPRMCELTGYSNDELLGKTPIEMNIIDPQLRTQVLRRVIKEKEVDNIEVGIHRKDRMLVNTLLTASKIMINNREILVAVLSDITELKKNQHEIRKLSIALEQSANSVVITDPKGFIEYANPKLYELTGYSPEELKGKKPNIFNAGFHSIDFYTQLWQEIKAGKIWKGEFLNRKKNGDTYWEKATITPILDEKGTIIHFLAIKEDVTEVKKRQEALAQSEGELRKLNATKDMFFSIIGHDLMNPFNALMGFNELMQEAIQEKNFELASNYSNIVNDSSRRIFTLLQNLLVWSRAQSGKMVFQPVAIQVEELVNTSIGIFKDSFERKKITFEKEILTQETIFVDQNMIGTVIRNLVGNAIKFSDKGGKIVLQVKRIQDEVLFQISDSGVGISEAQVNELFNIEKTISTKGTEGEAGTGLGLILCKEFILAHQGKIGVESKQGQGSRFYFTIPVTW